MSDQLTMKRDHSGFRLETYKIRLEVIEGPDKGLIAELPGLQARIGTGKECNLVLTDHTVSRVHLSARIDGGQIRIVDAGSTNGTSIDGIRIRDAYARPDSLIAVGDTKIRLRMLDNVAKLPLSTRDRFGGLLGASVAMRTMFAILERIAPTEMTVLIEGENGTGKELVAEALHENSHRAAGPFVVVDCGAVVPTLVESELFGHVKGSFTGAVTDHVGAFEAAHCGTLFLDEVGELPIDLQPKLLRALERREVRRVGATAARRVNVRVISATNRLLASEVERGQFRMDLYHRLAVIPVSVPPLRERLDDIPLLVRHFEKDLLPLTGATAPLSDDVVHGFSNRAWPGNIRQLRNEVARALSLGLSSGQRDTVPLSMSPDALFTIDLSKPLLEGRKRVADAYDNAYIDAALKATGGNISRAADMAQVTRRFIQRAMKRMRGEVDEEEG